MNAIVSFRLCKLSDEELIKKVDSMTDDMYTHYKIPPRHIPAKPDSDYDLLVGELLVRFKKKIDGTDTISYKEPKSRCCGRCLDPDECIGETVCKDHNEAGCERCFGPREPKPEISLD